MRRNRRTDVGIYAARQAGDGLLDELRDMRGAVDNVMPGEPEHRPSERDEIVLARAVVLERFRCGVVLEAVDLDRELELRIGSIDSTDEAARFPDLVLQGEGRKAATLGQGGEALLELALLLAEARGDCRRGSLARSRAVAAGTAKCIPKGADLADREGLGRDPLGDGSLNEPPRHDEPQVDDGPNRVRDLEPDSLDR